jgi:hypothetical protein
MRYGVPAHASLSCRILRAGALEGVPSIRFYLPLAGHTWLSFPKLIDTETVNGASVETIVMEDQP